MSYKIWVLDRETMILNLCGSGSGALAAFPGKVIVATWGEGKNEWAMYNLDSRRFNFTSTHTNYCRSLMNVLSLSQSVWTGKMEEGQEEIRLTRICEKDVKIMIQEERSLLKYGP